MMTDAEMIDIVNMVLASIRANSKTIEQLTPVTELADTDSIESSGGKRIDYRSLSQRIKELSDPDFNAVYMEIGRRAVEEAATREQAIDGLRTEFASVAAEISLSEIGTALLPLDALGKVPAVAKVKVGNRCVGVLMQHTDSQAHQRTQVFLTNYVLTEDGQIDESSHTDEKSRMYHRHYVYSRNAWTPWRDMVGERLQAMTEEEYEAIEYKDDDVFYFVYEE